MLAKDYSLSLTLTCSLLSSFTSLPSVLPPASQQCAIARAAMLVTRLQSPGHSCGVLSLASAAVSCSLHREGPVLSKFL